MQVSLIDLKAQYLSIKSEIDKAIENVLRNGNFILGVEVKKFEEEVARYTGVKYAIGVNSGTDALFLALKSLNIGSGDEVIIPSFSFFATAGVISLTGAKPVFVDIRPDTYNIDTTQIKDKITKNTKAIIPVHLYGQPVDLDEILSIAKEYNLKIIEDSAQAIGAEYKGRKVCSFGDIGALSFYPTKNLGACGDAGMILTNSEELAKKLKSLRTHGESKKYIHSHIGINSRLDELQAVILHTKFKYLEVWNEKRRRNAKIYNNLLKNVVIPYELDFVKHVYHQYTVRVKEREKLQKYLQEKGISTAIHYPCPIHLQEAYQKLGYNVNLPESEKAAKEVLSLPNYPEISEEAITYVACNINNFNG
ncbi:MAG: DegT/DnrJ/EryC1/StrS family aminotransferase [Candidatus Firestonebacteria bacterium]